MTNKEAIYILNNRLNTYYCTDEDLQAIDLAIKALEEPEEVYINGKDYNLYLEGYKQGKKDFERPQGDLISRSEAEKLGATCLAKRNENGQLEAIISLDNAPTVCGNNPKWCESCVSKGKCASTRPQGDFTRNELKSWLYRIASDNLDNELGRSCEEIICRLNGFERFVSDMRKGDAV